MRIEINDFGQIVFRQDYAAAVRLPVFDVVESEHYDDLDYHLADAECDGGIYDLFEEYV